MPKRSTKKKPSSRSKSKNYKINKKVIEELVKQQSRKNWIWIYLIIGVFVLALILLLILNGGFFSGKVISGQAVTNPCGSSGYASYQDCLNQLTPLEGASSAAVTCGQVCSGSQTPAPSSPNIQNPTSTSGQQVQAGSWDYILGGYPHPLLISAFTYLFGVPISGAGTSNGADAIITIAVWLFVVFTFSDVIATFSTFHKWVSWVIGFLIAVIVANFGWLVVFIAWTTAIFAVLGTVSVYVGLGAAFAAFIAINIGLGGFARWALKRQAAIIAAKAEAGGKKLQGTLAGLGDIEKALERIGSK